MWSLGSGATQMSTGSRVGRVVSVAAGLAALCLAGWAAVIARAATAAPSAAHLASAVGLFVAAVILRVDVRVGSSRLVFLWGDTAFVLVLVLLPLPWVVLATTVGKAVGMAVMRLKPIKSVYNAAAHTIAASAVTAVVGIAGAVVGPWQIRLGALLAAGAGYDLLCTALAAVVVGTANGSNPVTVWRTSLGMQGLTMAGNLTVTAGALALVTLDPRLVLAVPPAAVVLHQAYQAVQHRRSDRESGRRLARAITALGHLDESTVLSRTAAHAAELLSAVSAEVVHYTPSSASADEVYSYPDGGPPHDAYRWTHAVPLLGSGEGRPFGEIRVHFTQPVRLADREHAALQALAAASSNALAAAKAHAHAAYLATHDPVTSLPTRQLLLKRIDAHLDGAAHSGTPVGMILIGLVEFTEVAHALGDEARDDLLRHAADRLRHATTRDETAARMDGCDFGVFVPDIPNFRHISGRAETLLAGIATPARLRYGTVSLDARAGITFAPPNTIDSAELLRQATVALARTRRALTPVEYYRAVDDTSAGPATLLIAAELQQALADDQLALCYQPIIDLNDGTPVAAEATVHWLHPTRGLSPPHQFLPVLEHGSLLSPYTDWLLHEALAERARWTDLDPALPVSINLCAASLLDRDLPRRVAGALSDAGVKAHQLMVEVADATTVGAMTTGDAVLEELGDLGVRIAVDDFGSGCSSLTRLIRVPASYLKISPKIVNDLLGSPQAHAIVTAAAELARTIDLRVVAVGVRTPEHLLAARDAGANAAQGPAIAAPQDAGTAHGLLLDRTRRSAAEPAGRVVWFRPRDLDDPA